MKISILGDSLSTFYSCALPDYMIFYDINKAMENRLSGIEDTWWYKVIELLGGELLINGAYSGSRVSGEKFPAANSYERIKALQTDEKPDCIIIHLGHNDYAYNVPLENFYNDYVLMLERLKEVYPDARIISSTVMQTYIMYRPEWNFPEKNWGSVPLKSYNDAIKKASKLCKVECADICATGIKYDTLDGSHGTDRGNNEIFEAWEKALNGSCFNRLINKAKSLLK